ncbi:MAG: AAA family ATPase [Magnetococcales bacterium]|nr:AAA family ATPase [Magnetococcales bacterium]
MILKSLTLENFKGIRESVRIEFAPVILLFGANNTGRNTVVQALYDIFANFELQFVKNEMKTKATSYDPPPAGYARWHHAPNHW